MPKGGPSKYRPLADYLAAQPPAVTELTLTLPGIERVIGAPVPPGARLRTFWANYAGGPASTPQAGAWRAAGWRVAAVRYGAGGPAVTFARRPSAEPCGATRPPFAGRGAPVPTGRGCGSR